MDKIAKTPKRLVEADLIAKGHTHIVPGSLRFDTDANKQKVTINTVDENGIPDGNTREIATSDLHQCRTTVETKERMDRAKANEKAKAKRARAKLAAASAPVATALPESNTSALEAALS